MKIFSYKKLFFYIGRNIIFCAFLMGMYYLSSILNNRNRSTAEVVSYHAFLIIGSFYLWAMFHNSILFEKLLLRRKYVFYFASLILGIWLISTLHCWIMSTEKGAKGATILGAITANYLYTCLAVIFYLAFKYIIEQKKFYHLGIMQRDIELQQLKAHLNPHFLFNALNNIYSYTLQHNRYGDELILKLAELMRFILDNADKNEIKLQDELNFINNYIVFERERLGERCQIHLNCVGDIGDRRIAPLMLFPFIENACKYGADTIQKTEIDISIENKPAFLKLIVKNSIVNKTPPSTKTGLQKAIRRLELLYPNKHEVLITSDDIRFSVELILQYNER